MFFLEARVRGRVERWPLDGRRVRVGRGASCEITIDDPTLSREHLALELAEGIAHVEDLASTNGLRVEGELVREARLERERWFVAGAVLLAVREGISMSGVGHGGLEGPAPNAAREARPKPLAATESATCEFGATDGSLTMRVGELATPELVSLAAELRAASTRDEALGRLVRHALEAWPGLRGAALLRPLPGGVEVLALAGEAPPDEAETPARPEPAASVRLLLHPTTREQRAAPLLALIEELAALLVRTTSEGHKRAPRSAREEDEGARRAQPAPAAGEAPSFLHASARCRELLDEVDRLARTRIPVLLLGESGTGKELLARRLHAHSERAGEPFVALNCAALPAELLEAELFGIERGVATGVDARGGRLLEASGGTFLLDEIGDLPLRLQPKLLRVLEERSLRPLGAPAELPVDVRLVASTHRDLDAMVREGRFREDLYHRVAGAVVRIPPLRERREDVLVLARAFLREAALEQGRVCVGLDMEAARRLVEYRWPGNARELRHVVARAVALGEGPVLHAATLPPQLAADADQGAGDVVLALRADLRSARREFERLYFEQLLERARGNLSEAARIAGVTRSHLYSKLEELGLR